MIASIAAALFGRTAIAAAFTTPIQSGRLSPAPPSFALVTSTRPATLANVVKLSSHTRNIAEHRLRVGDLVRFRSGGPMMTVRTIKGRNAICNWANWTGKLQSHSFPIAELVAIGAPA